MNKQIKNPLSGMNNNEVRTIHFCSKKEVLACKMNAYRYARIDGRKIKTKTFGNSLSIFIDNKYTGKFGDNTPQYFRYDFKDMSKGETRVIKFHDSVSSKKAQAAALIYAKRHSWEIRTFRQDKTDLKIIRLK